MTIHRTTYNFTAIVSLFPTDKGGRKKPVYDHYRPSFSFNSANHISGEVFFPDQHELVPGETTSAVIKLLPSKHVRRDLKRGDSFTILEGVKVIGTGVIQTIDKEDRITSIH